MTNIRDKLSKTLSMGLSRILNSKGASPVIMVRSLSNSQLNKQAKKIKREKSIISKTRKISQLTKFWNLYLYRTKFKKK